MGIQQMNLARQYFAGEFLYADSLQKKTSPERFQALSKQFFQNHDDFYHHHYAQYGDKVDAVVAVVELAASAFLDTHGHLPICYKNCAISSGTNAHHDAVFSNYHTTDHLSRAPKVGVDVHTEKHILPNSTRSLQRAREVQGLMPDHYLITPSAFEGGTRVFSKGSGSTLTGGLPFDGADYMSFWNMVIDRCTGFILDDVKKDMPTLDAVVKEIEQAQSGSKEKRDRKLSLETSDWANSRNSILEMYRGNLIRLGLHPLRPDAKMDMRIYDTDTHSLYQARLVDCIKPAIQNVLRWTPQGIAAEEACRTVARIFNLHRMRTDPDFNAEQIAPLELDKLDPVIAKPSKDEIQEMDRLIDEVEPFLLRYCAHLIRPEGLPESYAYVKDIFPIQANDIGEKSLEWQRKTIPVADVRKLWALTLPRDFKPEDACPNPDKKPYAPHRRSHDLEGSPFDKKWESVLWEDNPYRTLSEMEQDLARLLIGVLETGLLPLNAPDFHGIVHDSKRGTIATDRAKKEHLDDVALLSGHLGKTFSAEVKQPNLQIALDKIDELRHSTNPPSAAFGTPVVSAISEAVHSIWHRLPGPGKRPGSDFRLAIAMKMMDRNETTVSFQDGWQTSEDSARLMLRATLIELEQIDRPFEGKGEIKPMDYSGNYISFRDRYEALRQHVVDLTNSPRIQKLREDGDAAGLENTGIRHITVALARMMEIHDAFVDPVFNAGRFDFHKIRALPDFKKNIADVQTTKDSTRDTILKNWVWLWDEKDFAGLRREYREAWTQTHGAQAQQAGAKATFDQGITRRDGIAP